MNVVDAFRLAPSVRASMRTPGAVYKLLLSVTGHCPLRCVGCAIWRKATGPELTPDEIARVLRGLGSLRWLALTGGEIPARADANEVADVVRAASPRLLFLTFPTSGFLPDETVEFAARLAHPGAPRPVVTVSIDGPADLHDELRGRTGAFERAIVTARALSRDPRLETFVGTTLGARNVARVDETFAALSAALPELVPARWHVNVMMHAPHFYGGVAEPEPEVAAILEAVRRVERLRGVPRTAFACAEAVFLRGLRYRLRTGRALVPCQALSASVHVAATGEVSPCHVRGPELGNVRDVDFEVARLLTSPSALAARAAILDEPCSRCWSPCEAYHAIVASPVLAALRSVSPPAR